MLSFEPSGLYLACLVLAPAVLLLAHVYRTLKRPITRLPGPWISKWTVLVLRYYWLTGRRVQYVHRLHQKYGPVVRLSPDEVSFSDVAVTKEIYSVKELYLKTEFYTRATEPGTFSIFNVRDVNLHRRYRRLLSNAMTESSLKTMYPVIEANVDLAIQKMREENGRRGAADVFKWWLFMATDIIGELTFGESFRMLAQGKKNEYIRDLEGVDTVSTMRALFPWLLSVVWLLPLPALRRIRDATARSFRYAEESLARHQRLELADPAAAARRPTLFSRLFKAEETEQLSFRETRDNAMTYIIAGSDTTSNTLTYLVWAVCRRPDVRAALLRELAGLPSATSTSTNTEKSEGSGFADQELKRLPYLNAVVDEALRLYSAVPASLPRLVPAGGARLAGYWLEGGTTVGSQAYTLHRDPATFPRPDEFDPSRWLAPTKAMREAFFAFGGGARICIGMHLARMELRLATARFFLAFPNATISELEGMSDEDMQQMMYFLQAPKGKRCLVKLY